MIKKYFLLIILSVTAFLGTSAQQKAPAKPARVVIINKSDGVRDTLMMSDVDKITFGYSTEGIEAPAVADSVDLGLSVKWASFNLGATAEEEPGYLVGWGDNTLVCTSENLNFYPQKNPPSSLIGTDYDVARLLWEENWRMPTEREFQELVDLCTWEWDEDRIGFVVTGPNGNSIFIPVAGYRLGKQVVESSLLEGYYWTGMLSSSSTQHALAAVMKSVENEETGLPQDTVMMLAMERYLGMMIRPVHGDYVLPLSISSFLQGEPGYSNATIGVTFDGDATGVTAYGVAYEAVPEDDADFNFGNVKKVECTGAPAQETMAVRLTGLDEDVEYRAMAYAVIGTDTVKSRDLVLFTTDCRYVDLGLSVKWAKWNIGAESETEYGGFYGWGDPTGEENSPYNNHYAVGNTSTCIAGNPKYDIATAQWGGHWRLPTREEFQEMIDAASSASWSYNTNNGVKKYVATFPNGKKLEFPIDGYMNSTLTEKAHDTHGYYWTADASTDLLSYALHISGPRSRSYQTSEKSVHVFVRPVYDEGLEPTPDDDDEEPETAEAGKAIDLGLWSGTLWADHNVGAKSETQAGWYVAWGELTQKISDGYFKDNYAYLDPESQYDGYSTALGEDIAGTEYDVAHVRWGGYWAMPTDEQFKELRDDCTWTPETRKNVYGYKVTGPNGNSIFLPCSGKYNGSSLLNYNEEGDYWCSTMYMFAREYQMGYAMIFNDTDGCNLSRYSRKGGLNIRPVKNKKK